MNKQTNLGTYEETKKQNKKRTNEQTNEPPIIINTFRPKNAIFFVDLNFTVTKILNSRNAILLNGLTFKMKIFAEKLKYVSEL
jgi:hypothetical protein